MSSVTPTAPGSRPGPAGQVGNPRHESRRHKGHPVAASHRHSPRQPRQCPCGFNVSGPGALRRPRGSAVPFESGNRRRVSPMAGNRGSGSGAGLSPLAEEAAGLSPPQEPLALDPPHGLVHILVVVPEDDLVLRVLVQVEELGLVQKGHEVVVDNLFARFGDEASRKERAIQSIVVLVFRHSRMRDPLRHISAPHFLGNVAKIFNVLAVDRNDKICGD